MALAILKLYYAKNISICTVNQGNYNVDLRNEVKSA